MGHIGVGELLVLMILGIMFTLPLIFGIILFAFLRRRKQMAPPRENEPGARP